MRGMDLLSEGTLPALLLRVPQMGRSIRRRTIENVEHRAPAGNPAWNHLAPYAVGVVELDEGPSILSHILADTHDYNYLQRVRLNILTPGEQPLPFFEIHEQEERI